MRGRLAYQSFSNVAATAAKKARIVEVGLRDGLQNEKALVSLDTKLQLLDKLYSAGLRDIEAGAFVSPQWVPQMKDTKDIFTHLKKASESNKYSGAMFSALVPNVKGVTCNVL
ncbi:hypothetical protein EON65_28630 [archaeon]|nr:MAG: hypothetical protein EON65_28630 [archaeon]